MSSVHRSPAATAQLTVCEAGGMANATVVENLK
jgi:hypothetical protein